MYIGFTMNIFAIGVTIYMHSMVSQKRKKSTNKC